MTEKTAPEAFHCLDIAVSAPVRETFLYAVPAELRSLVSIGSRVVVPFNGRKMTGYVVKEGTHNPLHDLKEIKDIEEQGPLFHPQMVPFFQWIADYYRHPLGMVIHASVPGERFKSATLTPKGKTFIESTLFDSEEVRILRWIGQNPGKKLPWPMGKILPFREKGWVRLENQHTA